MISTAVSKPGYMKIRLTYQTGMPKHVRSLMLAAYGAFPPFHEDVCVLMPRMQVFTVLESFLPAFNRLRENGVLHSNDKLVDFKLLNEDKLTQAYVCDLAQ